MTHRSPDPETSSARHAERLDTQPSNGPAGPSERARLIWGRFGDRIVFYARRKTGNVDDAADICQDVYVALQKAIGENRLENPDNPGPYLYGICRKIIARHFENKRRRLSLDEIPERSAPASAEASLITQETHERLGRVFARLSLQDRRILTLKYVEGWSFVRIAGFLGMKEPAVRQRASRAYGSLRKGLPPV